MDFVSPYIVPASLSSLSSRPLCVVKSLALSLHLLVVTSRAWGAHIGGGFGLLRKKEGKQDQGR